MYITETNSDHILMAEMVHSKFVTMQMVQGIARRWIDAHLFTITTRYFDSAKYVAFDLAFVQSLPSEKERDLITTFQITFRTTIRKADL